MSKVQVIFVPGTVDSGVDKIISLASGGPFVHVAVKVPGVGLVESLGEGGPNIIPPCVRISSWRKYDNADVKIFDVELPNFEAAQAEAEKLIGTAYGYDNCIVTGLHDVFGLNLPDDGLLTAHCSKTAALILRAGGDNILSSIAADNISPEDEEKALEGVQ